MSQRRSSPSGLFSRAEDALKLSDDVIKADFIITPDSRIWDLSPMRLEVVVQFHYGEVIGVAQRRSLGGNYFQETPSDANKRRPEIRSR